MILNNKKINVIVIKKKMKIIIKEPLWLIKYN